MKDPKSLCGLSTLLRQKLNNNAVIQTCQTAQGVSFSNALLKETSQFRQSNSTDIFQSQSSSQYLNSLLNSRTTVGLPVSSPPNRQQPEVSNNEPLARISMAQSVLQNAAAAQLRERIQAEGEVRLRMRLNEFMDLCIEEGFAKSEEQAKELCQSMHNAGVLLWHSNVVYLRPLEVAEMILEALPDTEEEIRDKVKKLSLELHPLKQQKEQCDRVAEFWSSTLLWGGFFALVCQFITFFILTFQITSWDVMEPVTYFAGQILVLLGYIYFLTTREDFGFRNVTDKLHNTFFNQQTQQLGKFDLQRYNKLVKDISRWQRYLKKFKYII
eukprot:TRINITY_DN8974_c0_g1_i6.p1 TRINITY_DN8974_c0_g1~~TRINITY_DN8974_c0_g1_i6.p1  ORF type:complete len:327 (-),score=36.90 TRINITY_DN8974_c0_g1_i6:2488-3468(-)